jgi:hypothetical protein
MFVGHLQLRKLVLLWLYQTVHDTQPTVEAVQSSVAAAAAPVPGISSVTQPLDAQRRNIIDLGYTSGIHAPSR